MFILPEFVYRVAYNTIQYNTTHIHVYVIRIMHCFIISYQHIYIYTYTIYILYIQCLNRWQCITQD